MMSPKNEARTEPNSRRKESTFIFKAALSLLVAGASFFSTQGNVMGDNPTISVYGNDPDLSDPAAYIGGAYPYVPGTPPTYEGIAWFNRASGVFTGTLQTNFTFDAATVNQPNIFTSLALTKWSGDVTVSGAPITLNGDTNQINTGTANNLIINSNLTVAAAGNSESWLLTDELTLAGQVSGTGAQTVTVNGSDESVVSLNLTGASNASNVNFALNGVQVAITNSDTFGNLSLLQSSTIAVGGTAPGTVDTFTGGFTAGSNPANFNGSNTLTITGWQGQIGNNGGGTSTKLYFANNVAGTAPNGVALFGIVTDVVFDLSTNTAGSNGVGNSFAGGPSVPNFIGDPTGDPANPTMGANDDYGEWIVGPSGFDELVPYFGPVPEPKTVIAALALLSFLVWRERRRLTSLYAQFSSEKQTSL